MSELNRLLILYGSETGCSLEIAEQIQIHAIRRNFQVELLQMNDYLPYSNIISEDFIIFVSSTTGDGECPYNMKKFWHFLLRKDHTKDLLRNLKFVVFGLGDSSYAKFNAVARKLRVRLLQLGGKEMFRIGLGDDRSELGVEGDFDKWNKMLWETVLSLEKYKLPEGFVIDESPRLEKLKYNIVFYGDDDVVSGFKDEWSRLKALIDRDLIPEEALKHISKQLSKGDDRSLSLVNAHDLNHVRQLHQEDDDCYAMYNGTVTRNERISADHFLNQDDENDSMNKDVRFIEFSMPNENDKVYAAGDIVVIYPTNRPTYVASLLQKLNVDANQIVSVNVNEKVVFGPISIYELFERFLDIKTPLSRKQLETLYFFVNPFENEIYIDEREKILELSQPENNDLYQSYIKKERRGLIDIINDFSFSLPLIYLVNLLHKIRPREYSISSSPTFHFDSSLNEIKVQVVVSLVRYLTPTKRQYIGFCSRFFQDLEITTVLPLLFKKGALNASLSKNLILIGPGTGVAPCRSIIYERFAKNCDMETALFFGCRRVDEDFLFGTEWRQMNDKFYYFAAFSRHSKNYSSNFFNSLLDSNLPKFDTLSENTFGRQKMYVQHLLHIDHIKQLFFDAVVNKNASVFVCGAAKKMPTDVKEAIVELVCSQGKFSQVEAEKYVSLMQRQRRYIVEAWS